MPSLKPLEAARPEPCGSARADRGGSIPPSRPDRRTLIQSVPTPICPRRLGRSRSRGAHPRWTSAEHFIESQDQCVKKTHKTVAKRPSHAIKKTESMRRGHMPNFVPILVSTYPRILDVWSVLASLSDLWMQTLNVLAKRPDIRHEPFVCLEIRPAEFRGYVPGSEMVRNRSKRRVAILIPTRIRTQEDCLRNVLGRHLEKMKSVSFWCVLGILRRQEFVHPKLAQALFKMRSALGHCGQIW